MSSPACRDFTFTSFQLAALPNTNVRLTAPTDNGDAFQINAANFDAIRELRVDLSATGVAIYRPDQEPLQVDANLRLDPTKPISTYRLFDAPVSRLKLVPAANAHDQRLPTATRFRIMRSLGWSAIAQPMEGAEDSTAVEFDPRVMYEFLKAITNYSGKHIEKRQLLNRYS